MEIGGEARSQDPYGSRGSPEAVDSGPPSRCGPHSPPRSTLRNHSSVVGGQRAETGKSSGKKGVERRGWGALKGGGGPAFRRTSTGTAVVHPSRAGPGVRGAAVAAASPAVQKDLHCWPVLRKGEGAILR